MDIFKRRKEEDRRQKTGYWRGDRRLEAGGNAGY